MAQDFDPAAIYQQRLQDAMLGQRFQEIAQILDAYELETEHFGAPNLHLLGHIYNMDLEDARFLWKRLGVANQQGSDMAGLHSLLKTLWQKDYQDVSAVIVQQAWSPELVPMIASFSEKLRTRTLHLLARAYSSLSLPTAVALTGWNQSEVAAELASRGWQLDSASQCFKRTEHPKAEMRTSLQDLDRLTGYVVHLESG